MQHNTLELHKSLIRALKAVVAAYDKWIKSHEKGTPDSHA